MEACGLRVERTHGAGIEDASLYFQILHAVLGIAFPPGSKDAEPEVASSANYGRLVALRRRWEPDPSRDATEAELQDAGIGPLAPGQVRREKRLRLSDRLGPQEVDLMAGRYATPEELRRHGISPRPPGQLKP